MGTLATPPPAPNNDYVQQALEFARGQADKEIEHIEKLFDRAKTMFLWVLASTTVVAAVFGFSTYKSLQGLVKELVSDGMKRDVPVQIDQQLKKANIEATIQNILQHKTEAEFQDAINTAVAVQLDTPQRQKLLDSAIQRQVDLWFATHQQVLQTAAQRKVDVLTEHLQQTVKIFELGAATVTPTARSGPALHELQKLAKTSPDNSLKELATAQIAIASQFWGSGTRFLVNNSIKTLDDKGLKPPYQTCDLLDLLHSTNWRDRAMAINFLGYRPEKGVPDALMEAMKDEYLEVAAGANLALRFTLESRPTELQTFFPDVGEFQTWWFKEGLKSQTLKPLNCKANQ